MHLKFRKKFKIWPSHPPNQKGQNQDKRPPEHLRLRKRLPRLLQSEDLATRAAGHQLRRLGVQHPALLVSDAQALVQQVHRGRRGQLSVPQLCAARHHERHNRIPLQLGPGPALRPRARPVRVPARFFFEFLPF